MDYKPKIVKAILHTGGKTYEQIKAELKGQGFTCKQMKAMVREHNYWDGLTLYLSLWNWDNHESWHLWNWEDKDDERVMLAIYEAEQYHPFPRYKDDFEQFKKDWKNKEYDPGASISFPLDSVEVLEVLQEEEDNIDHEAAQREVRKAENMRRDSYRRQRMEQDKLRGMNREQRRKAQRKHGKA